MRIKVLKTIIVLIALACIISNFTYAFAEKIDLSGKFSGDIEGDASKAKTAAETIIGTILDVVRIVGMAVAMIILTFIGIKFMLASPSERANIKQYSMNYIIGAFILIGGVSLLTVVKNFADKIKV